MQKLQLHETGEQLQPREKLIVNFIQDHPGCKSGEITKAVGLSRIIVIRSLSVLIDKKMIEKHGTGSGTHYTIA